VLASYHAVPLLFYYRRLQSPTQAGMKSALERGSATEEKTKHHIDQESQPWKPQGERYHIHQTSYLRILILISSLGFISCHVSETKKMSSVWSRQPKSHASLIPVAPSLPPACQIHPTNSCERATDGASCILPSFSPRPNYPVGIN